MLLINALSSVSTGLFAVLFAPTVEDLIGVDQHWLIRLVGLGLVGFALLVMAVGRSDTGRLVPWAAVISINDFGWVAATVVVVALGWLSAGGVMIMGTIAGFVGLFGLLQVLARRQLLARP